MGQRYVQEYDENENAIDPTFWLENHNTYAGEFNGGLDRDNFPQATIEAAEVASRPFTTVYPSNQTTGFAASSDTTTWQGGGATGASGIDTEEWTATEDSHYDIHASITWTWDGSCSWTNATPTQTGSAGQRPTDADPEITIWDTMMLRMTVDGVTIATAGPFDDAAISWSAYLCGAVQLPAGTHVFNIECLVVKRKFQDQGLLEGVATNTVTFGARARTILQRSR